MAAANLSIITMSRTPEYVAELYAGLELELLTDQHGLPDTELVLVSDLADNERRARELAAIGLSHSAKVVQPVTRLSYAEGNNLGAKVADGHWLLLLNDDCRPTFTMLLSLWKHRTEASVVGSLLLHENETVNHAGTLVRLNGATDHLGRNAPRGEWVQERAVLVPSVTFAAVLLNAETFRELGGLDERYRYGWEDTDYCLRVLERGGQVRVDRNAIGYHGECGTRPRGGQADVANFQTFQATWPRQRLERVLGDYVQRVRPEPVEGV